MKVRIAIRPKPIREDGTVNIKIAVCLRGKTRFIGTEYYVNPKFFDEKARTIKSGSGYSQVEADRANAKLQIMVGSMTEKAMSHKVYDIEDLLNILQDKRTDYNLYTAIDDRIEKYNKSGNINYSGAFNMTRERIKKFTGEGLVPFQRVNYSWLIRFENWMRSKEMKPNSIGIHMRNIRTVFNEAIAMGRIDQSLYPFRKYKIPKEATRKRNLTAEELSKIAKAELKGLHAWARDMFMLSFYLLGINLKDLFYLQGIEDGRVYYIRSKGKKPYSVKVFPEAMNIINRYKGQKYLLNTLENYSDYRSATKRVNKKLKDIAKDLRIEKPVSTYFARHAWASIASGIGISEDIIARALGHTISNQMTIIYIDFDLEKVDEANRRVINHVLKTPHALQIP